MHVRNVHTESVHTQGKRLACAREILAGAEMKMGVESAQIRTLDKEKGICRGSVYHVNESMGILLHTLGGVMSADMWVGVVALPEVGWRAAESYGVDLERIVVLPEPAGGMDDVVLSALMPVMDIVVCGHVCVTSSQRQRLAASARQHRTLLLTWQSWSGVSRPLNIHHFHGDIYGGESADTIMRKAQ